MDKADTICAIATGMTDAGIGIVRVSGPGAVAVADRILVDSKGAHTLQNRAANTIRLMRVTDEQGSVLDEALVSVLRAPMSYTGEDTVEINTHGGRRVMEETLSLLLAAGKADDIPGTVRLAEPGEYTKRAFLAGKMDLTKAEAVQDLIAADNDFALKNAAKQLSGALKEKVTSLRERLLHETAFLEAALDDPDVYGEELDAYPAELKKKLTQINGEIGEMLAHFDEGVLRKDGFSCAIIGPVNAGKSSLLNALTGTERAIVTDIPGTTRDTVEETVRFHDVLMHLADTAGIRETEDIVEAEGVKRAKKAAEEAQLTLFVLDASVLLEEKGDLRAQLPDGLSDHTLLLLNKADLLQDAMREDITHRLREIPFFFTSAKTGEGLQEVKEQLTRLALTDELAPKQEYYLTNLRHKDALHTAQEALFRVLQSAEKGASEELYLVDLMDAYTALSSIIGEAVSEDLIDKIFADFCMGK